jgi:ABC-type phosphate/phosphonate transport system permease subunit
MAESALVSRRWSKPPFIKDPRLRWGIGLGVAIYLALAFGTLEINWGRVAEGLPRGVKFIAAFFPPDFISRSDEIFDGIYESLWMAVTSTVIGIALSIPVGLGAARNLAPRPIYLFCRGILAVSRSPPDLPLLPRHSGGQPFLPGGDPRHFLRQAVRFRPVRRFCHLERRHCGLLRQVAGRGY